MRFGFFSLFVPARVIKDKVGNRNCYFEITAFLNSKQGTSRAGNSNENTNTNKSQFLGNEPTLDTYSSFNEQKCGNFKISFPVL